MKDSFFMVYVENADAPKYIHNDMNTALAEAKRLAECLNRKTYVLQSVVEVELTKFQITPMQHISEMPF